MHTYVA